MTGGSGPKSCAPFAYFDPDTSSWRTCQASLFEDSETSSPDWPSFFTWDLRYAYELPTSVPRTGESGSSCSPLLPTPSSAESTPTDGFVEEARGAGIRPDERLYLPGRKWHAQRTLSRIVPALLPTPSANDATGAESETRDARRETGQTGGPSLRDLPRLLPTPAARDEKGRDKPFREGGSGLPETVMLLPTPTAQLAHDSQTHRSGARTEELLLGGIAKAASENRLLPTPTAGDGRSSGSRNLEGSKAHMGVSLTDAVRFGNSQTPRLLPTPQASDGDGGRVERGAMSNQGRRPSGQKATLPLGTAIELSGELSSRPFASGNPSSDPHPDQLTLADASAPTSSSGCSATPPDGRT